MALFTVTNNEGVIIAGIFLGSAYSGLNGCNGNTATIDTTYYHNGAGVYPAVGDTIYIDAGLTTILDTARVGGGEIYTGPSDPVEAWVQTTPLGVRQLMTCK